MVISTSLHNVRDQFDPSGDFYRVAFLACFAEGKVHRQSLKGVLQELEGEVEIPRSVPGLVTRRVLVMNYLQGEQITRLKRRVEGMSPRVRKIAQTRLLHRIADAYGMMIIKTGLFQADAHPGNLLVLAGTPP